MAARRVGSLRCGRGAAMLITPGTAACARDDVERLFKLVAEPTNVEAVCS
jgi:6-phosphofructokinase 2